MSVQKGKYAGVGKEMPVSTEKNKAVYCLKLRTDTEEIEISVIKSRRKTLSLEVSREGMVKARLPYRMSERAAEEFVWKHRDWILKKRAQMRRRRQEEKERGEAVMLPALSELDRRQLARIREKFLHKTEFFAEQMGVTYGKITIRSQRTRWGSCSSKGNLNFNYQLYFLPEELMDYVVIHELTHRRYMNHSADFWREVERFCPDYRKRRNALKQIGIAAPEGSA